VKVPQIINMMKAKSGAGVSLASMFFEMTAITFTMAYSVHKEFPFRLVIVYLKVALKLDELRSNKVRLN